jgi:pimeloyl-ACP methyl ester carboxylesterase
MKYFVARGEDRGLDVDVRRDLRGSYVRLSDGITHYELTGPDDGPLVVMAGGLTVPLFYWDDMARELHDRGLRTLAYSAYGRGYSDRVKGRYDEELFVRQLSELIDTVGQRASHLVGTSMGALIAMAYVNRPKTAATTLTLIGPAGLSPQPTAQKLLLRNDITATLIARTVGLRVLDQHVGHNVRDPRRSTDLANMLGEAFRFEGSLYGFFATLHDFPLFGRAELYRRTGSLPLPAQLIWGSDDDVTPIRSITEAKGLLRPDTCHVIEQCGHMAPFERPTKVASYLAAFTASQTERS